MNKVAKVICSNLRIRFEPSTDGAILGYAEEGKYYDILSTSKDDNFLWLKIDTNKWIANIEGCTEIYKFIETFDEEDIKEKVIDFLESCRYETNKQLSEFIEGIK